MLPENTRRQANPAKTSLRNSFFCSLRCCDEVWSCPSLFAFIFKVYFCNLLVYCKKNARGGIPALTMRNKNTPIKSHLELACLLAQQGWGRTALQARRAAPFRPKRRWPAPNRLPWTAPHCPSHCHCFQDPAWQRPKLTSSARRHGKWCYANLPCAQLQKHL